MRQRGSATTRTVLLTVLLLVIAALTGASLLTVWHRMRQQVTADFERELAHSVLVFRRADEERMRSLQREDDLLANLPSLKALMTTRDDRTIEDGAIEFWKVSGNDLFAITDGSLMIRAADLHGSPAGEELRRDLHAALQFTHKEYLVSAGHLFRYAVSPVYFGDRASGTLLGYVVTGYSIDAAHVTQLSMQADANTAFLNRNTILASSHDVPIAEAASLLDGTQPSQVQPVRFAGEPYLAVTLPLSEKATFPLFLMFYKSLRGPEREISEISRLLLMVGLCSVLAGSAVMVAVARSLTYPLELLARRVRAFGNGDSRLTVPRHGTREVQQLTADFETMQERITESNRARLENERLATIGIMASSVSHDLRHYLASIYANAEFLAAADVTEGERIEFLEDIRAAVQGTTEMLETLMIFSRTGASVRHAPEHVEVLLRRAVTQVKKHPDTRGVTISTVLASSDAVVAADGKQLERALYNLLLNASQSARFATAEPAVVAEVRAMSACVVVCVTDNGAGVSLAVQKTMFDPFVSAGKQNGTGLGLTLCRCIAQEHGGEVNLVRSAPGETVFELRLPRIGEGLAEKLSFMAQHAGGER